MRGERTWESLPSACDIYCFILTHLYSLIYQRRLPHADTPALDSPSFPLRSRDEVVTCDRLDEEDVVLSLGEAVSKRNRPKRRDRPVDLQERLSAREIGRNGGTNRRSIADLPATKA